MLERIPGRCEYMRKYGMKEQAGGRCQGGSGVLIPDYEERVVKKLC
jgi:hypothetical protein